jgi:hypothetical protein
VLPKVVIQNSFTLDGFLTDFELNKELHYRIAVRYKPDIQLIG